MRVGDLEDVGVGRMERECVLECVSVGKREGDMEREGLIDRDGLLEHVF